MREIASERKRELTERYAAEEGFTRKEDGWKGGEGRERRQCM